MTNHFFQNVLKASLVVSIMLGASFMNPSAMAEGSAGIYAKICGTGQLLFIPLDNDEDPEPTGPHMTACHAICASEELESDEEA